MTTKLRLFFALCILAAHLTECLSVRVDPTLPSYLLPGVSSQQDFSLTVRLNGTGFHKTLSVTASTCIKRVTNDVPNFAPIHFLLHITRDVYVDVDQLNALERHGGPQVTVSTHMDTEQPATLSSDHWLLVSGLLDVPWSLPLHLRYQAPSSQPYKSVTLPHPQLFVQCSKAGAADFWPSCDVNPSCNNTTCSWVSVPTGSDAHVLQLDVPCGLTHHSVVVVPVTIIITLVGSIHLIKKIKQVHTNCA